MYKRLISPLLGNHCRFYPTCSSYAIDAINYLPIHKALPMILFRILRCNPLFKGGFDPVKHKE